MKLKYAAQTLLLLVLMMGGAQSTLKAQELFEKTFRGCETDQFFLEKDSAYMEVDGDKIREILKNAISSADWNSLKGDLYLQILVDRFGRSCLLSLKNETNLKTSKFKIKKAIDEDLRWGNPTKKVSPVIHVGFTGHGVQLTRLGTGDGQGGFVLIRKSKIR